MTPEKTPSQDPSFGTKILPRLLNEEMKQSYLDYSMSVIVGRALPDIRDGLKPVHRRVLFTMWENGLVHNKPFRKSANVVGNCMAKYHPHGDMSIYDTLVRLAQDFSMRYLLVQGQGNFGSVDGDSAAAMRYCVTGDSLIVTEKGLERIDEISKDEDINLKILSKDKKIHQASKWFDSAEHDVLRITTNKGYSIKGTNNHPLLTLTKDPFGKPRFLWKLMEQIEEGDVLVIDRSTDSFWPDQADLSSFFPKIGKTTKKKTLPPFLDKNLAFVLGSFVAEGTLVKHKIEFCNTDNEFISEVGEKWTKTFPDSRLHYFQKKPNSYGKKAYARLECHSRYTLEFLRNIGLETAKSPKRIIPKIIFNSPKEGVTQFLKAYFEGDGSISSSGRMIELSCCSKSEELMGQIQILLLRLGIDSFKRYDSHKSLWKLYLRGYRNVLRFYKEIGFVSTRKTKKLELALCSYTKESSLSDYVPFISDYVRSMSGSEFIQKNNFDRYGSMEANYGQVSSILLEETGSDHRQMFEYLLTYQYLFDEVVKVEEAGIERVYSLKVESDCHSFISNGFISHNTEARLSKIAEEMLADIDKETVHFTSNFDNTTKEPSVLPSKLPNLLVNGSSGIAVGMATNIPPHNLGEVADGMITLIGNPAATIQDLMGHIKGPDFPTGGIIQGHSGIAHAYMTGRGKLLVRAKSAVEDIKGRKTLIITEIPYMVNKAELIKEIAELVNDKRIIGISDLRDESDRDGMRIVIELKKDADTDFVLNQLFSHTRLQTTFGVIMLALVNNIPRVLNLKEMMYHYLEHRKEIVTKRTAYDLRKAQERAHILEGLLIALKNIDEIVKLIKASKSTETAQSALIAAYTLSIEQSKAILEMRLSRLTSLEQDKIRQEHKDLMALISELLSILADPKKVLDIIKNELLHLKKEFGDNRRTTLTEMEAEALELEDLIEEGQTVVTVTKSGYVKRLPLATYKQQHRGGKGVIGTTTKEEDLVENIFVAHTHATLLCFTNKGKVHWLKTYAIPEASRQAKGKAIVNLLTLEKDETVTTIIPVKEFNDQNYLIMATRKGTIKKTNLIAYSHQRKSGIIAVTLDEGDRLMDVKMTDGRQEILLATAQGMAVRFAEEDVRPTGRSSSGVRGITLKDDEVIGMIVAEKGKSILTATRHGYGKRTPIDDYRLISRGGSGVINIQTSDRNGPVAAICCVSDDDEIMVITKAGITIRMPVSDISIIGRNTQGVRVMKLDDNDAIVSVTKVEKETQ